MTFRVHADLSEFNEFIKDLGESVEHAIRPAAQAGAQVLYDNVKENVASIGRVTGNLSNAIYQAYDKRNSNEQQAFYQVGWNARKAPHGHLLEYGHIQRYVTYVGKDGKWHTAVRPEMRGKKLPRGKLSQAVKDAYFVQRRAPIHVAAQPFMRPAADQMDKAIVAVEAEFFKRINVL